MRIIKEGKVPNVEYIFTCGYCACEFAVTSHELYNENSYINKNSYKCPTCGTQVYGYITQEIENTSDENIPTDANSDSGANE